MAGQQHVFVTGGCYQSVFISNSIDMLNGNLWLVQICIRWGLQHGTSVIPKATGDDHVVGNLDVLDWELSSEDYEVRISSLLKCQGNKNHQCSVADSMVEVGLAC